MKEALLVVFPWVFPFLQILCFSYYVETSLTTTFGFPFNLLFGLIGLQKDFSFKWLDFLQYWNSSFCLLSLVFDLFVFFLFPFIIGYNIQNDLIIVYIIMEFSSQIIVASKCWINAFHFMITIATSTLKVQPWIK